VVAPLARIDHFPILNRRHFMRGRTSYKRFAGIGVTVVLFAGIGIAIILLAGRSRPPSAVPPTVRAGDQREATLAADLVTAIRNGDAQAISRLLGNGADVNARDAEGNTPLILASFYASPQCVALLIDKHADVNAANKAGATPLIRAATCYEKSRLLVTAGANVRVRTALGNTPLILAARRAGNSRTVQLLLQRGANATERNDAGIGPVLSGAASGDVGTVRFLLDAGAQADDFPRWNPPSAAAGAAGMRTALMWAAYHNNVRMIRLLLQRGANPNQSTYFGNPLSHACWSDSFEAAELLIAHGANVNARDAVADFTPLHWAAGTESSRPHLVKLLLANSADPNAAGGEPVGAFGLVPQTPRLIAEKRGRTAIVAALVAAGAKGQPRAEKPATPHRALPEPLDHATLIASAEKAVAALQTTAAQSRESFLRHVSKQDCASCHQQYLPMAAVGHARNRSVPFDQEAAREQIDSLAKLTHPFFAHEFITQTLLHPDPSHTFGYHLFGFAAEGVPPSALTDGMVHYLLTVQASDGRWFNHVPRPPIQSGDVSATALAIQAIKHYSWPGRKQAFAASVERGRRWLWKVKAETNEEAVFQLLGLHWAGEPAEKLADLGKSLLQRQRKDGGWAQLPMLESDAYATGEVLYTLAQTVKHPVTGPAWQRGLHFLLERQEDDGTWHVARRAFPFQPTMDSGFPHNRDSWLSAAATSWAVLALTQVLPVGPASGKPTAVPPTPPVQLPKMVHKVDFAQQIKPLLERSCVACHGGDRPRGRFRIVGRETILQGGESGAAAIVPGHSEKSRLLDYVSGKVPESEMPPKAVRERFPALTTDEVALLRAWIDQGAEWPTGALLASPSIEKQQ
jgi:ankyrin repeat protein/mono/diheme cytochrome c family protein